MTSEHFHIFELSDSFEQENGGTIDYYHCKVCQALKKRFVNKTGDVIRSIIYD